MIRQQKRLDKNKIISGNCPWFLDWMRSVIFVAEAFFFFFQVQTFQKSWHLLQLIALLASKGISSLVALTSWVCCSGCLLLNHEQEMKALTANCTILLYVCFGDPWLLQYFEHVTNELYSTCRGFDLDK